MNLNRIERKWRVEQGDIDATLVAGVSHDVAVAEVLQRSVFSEVGHHRVVLNFAEAYQVNGLLLVCCHNDFAYGYQLLEQALLVPSPFSARTEFVVLLSLVVDGVERVLDVVGKGRKGLLCLYVMRV